MCLCILMYYHFKSSLLNREILHKSFLCIWICCFAFVEGLQQLIIQNDEKVPPCLRFQLVVLDCLTACLSTGLSLLHLTLSPCLSSQMSIRQLLSGSLEAVSVRLNMVENLYLIFFSLLWLRNLSFSSPFLIQIDL